MKNPMLVLAMLIANPMMIQGATPPSALQQLGGKEGSKVEVGIKEFKEEPKMQEIAFEDWSARLKKKCLHVETTVPRLINQREYTPRILRTQEEYAKAQSSRCKDRPLPAFNFDEKFLLGGGISSGGLSLSLPSKKVFIDQRNKRIIVKIDALSKGRGYRMITFAEFWLALPKNIPSDFTAKVEVNWIGDVAPPNITEAKAVQLAQKFLNENEADWGNPIKVQDTGDYYRLYYSTPQREEMLLGPRGIVVSKTGSSVAFSKRL